MVSFRRRGGVQEAASRRKFLFFGDGRRAVHFMCCPSSKLLRGSRTGNVSMPVPAPTIAHYGPDNFQDFKIERVALARTT